MERARLLGGKGAIAQAIYLRRGNARANRNEAGRKRPVNAPPCGLLATHMSVIPLEECGRLTGWKVGGIRCSQIVDVTSDSELELRACEEEAVECLRRGNVSQPRNGVCLHCSCQQWWIHTDAAVLLSSQLNSINLSALARRRPPSFLRSVPFGDSLWSRIRFGALNSTGGVLSFPPRFD